MMTQYPLIDDVIRQVQQIVDMKEIYVFSIKTNARQLSSFKLCVIADVCDARRAEHDIYMHVDCDISFDVLVYTPVQWQTLLHTPGSFASRIQAMGVCIHG